MKECCTLLKLKLKINYLYMEWWISLWFWTYAIFSELSMICFTSDLASSMFYSLHFRNIFPSSSQIWQSRPWRLASRLHLDLLTFADAIHFFWALWFTLCLSFFSLTFEFSARSACKHSCAPHRKSSARNMPKQGIQSLICISASPTSSSWQNKGSISGVVF